MISAIQQYKNSFTDVNLIYNMDEKIKRFTVCENLYNEANLQHNLIIEKCDLLEIKKGNIFDVFKSLE